MWLPNVQSYPADAIYWSVGNYWPISHTVYPLPWLAGTYNPARGS